MLHHSPSASALNLNAPQPKGKNFRNPLRILITVTALAGCAQIYTATNPVPARAQEQEGCFMRDSTGKLVNLSVSVCGLTPGIATGSPTPPTAGVFRAKIVRRDANIPVIEVTFNGKQKFEMMVDSGASGTVITPAMAKALSLVTRGTTRAKTPNGEATFPLGRLQSLEAGGLVVKDVVVAISPSLEIGLLGHDFFGDKEMTIKQDVIEFRARS